MKKINQYFLVMLLLALSIYSFAQGPIIHIEFKHMVGNKPLILFEETYTNYFNEPFTVNKFKYYISNIILKGQNNTLKLNLEPKLIDEADSSSKQITIPKPNFTIIAIEFTIGVDSSYNVTGIQAGDLDPLKGMYWTWNSGYIFAKLEGQSDSSKAPSHYFSYHIGGYKITDYAVRKIVIPIKQKSLGDINFINVAADILQWFNAKHAIQIAKNSICHQQGQLAMNLADNYSNMFTVIANK